MATLTVNIEGKTNSDLILALQEVLRRVEQGFTSGTDSNDDGEYYFDITGDYDE